MIRRTRTRSANSRDIEDRLPCFQNTSQRLIEGGRDPGLQGGLVETPCHGVNRQPMERRGLLRELAVVGSLGDFLKSCIPFAPWLLRWKRALPFGESMLGVFELSGLVVLATHASRDRRSAWAPFSRIFPTTGEWTQSCRTLAGTVIL
jgi:hypothetical protein